jgi:hypothetical protein
MISIKEIEQDIEIRDKILGILYQKYKEQPRTSRCSINELSEKLGLENKAIEFNIRFLMDNQFIESVSIPMQFRIAPKGIAVIEGPSKYNPPEDYRGQLIEISGSTVGQIIQAFHVNFSPSVLLNNLNQSIENHPDILPEQKKRWKDLLTSIPKWILEQIIQALIQEMFAQAGLGKK